MNRLGARDPCGARGLLGDTSPGFRALAGLLAGMLTLGCADDDDPRLEGGELDAEADSTDEDEATSSDTDSSDSETSDNSDSETSDSATDTTDTGGASKCEDGVESEGELCYVLDATLAAAGPPTTVHFANIDGSGYDDLLVASIVADRLDHHPNPAAALAESISLPLVSGVRDLRSVDLDQDGDLDLAFASVTLGVLGVANASTPGNFAAPGLITNGGGPRSI